ncbi:hypothetical protein LIER_32448 [Lithospermum erythrorhizon]|uniref:Uncharacterized protein n=1 Tax=Lithospermum erythrorhizon TaxID=34254 RepID=A0AAV3RWZ9_LITER
MNKGGASDETPNTNGISEAIYVEKVGLIDECVRGVEHPYSLPESWTESYSGWTASGSVWLSLLSRCYSGAELNECSSHKGC